MALAQTVIDSLEEAEQHLRNALAFAARGERSIVCKQISDLITNIDNLRSFDNMQDKIEEMIKDVE